jgi:hypothetical protein
MRVSCPPPPSPYPLPVADGGSIRLSFNGVVSRRIPWNADHDTLLLALTAIDSLYAVQIQMDGTSHQLCSSGGSDTLVTIVHPQVRIAPHATHSHAPQTSYRAPQTSFHAPQAAYHAPQTTYYAPRTVHHVHTVGGASLSALVLVKCCALSLLPHRTLVKCCALSLLPHRTLVKCCALSLLPHCSLQFVDLPRLGVSNDQSVSSQTSDNFPFVLAQLTLAGVVQSNMPVITEEVRGTRVSAGPDATGKSVGAVFVFKYASGPDRFTQVRRANCVPSLVHPPLRVAHSLLL